MLYVILSKQDKSVFRKLLFSSSVITSKFFLEILTSPLPVFYGCQAHDCKCILIFLLWLLFFAACSSKKDVNQQNRGYFTCYHCHFKTEQEKVIQQHLLLHNKNKIHKMHPVHATESDSSATEHIKTSQRFICDTCDATYSDLHNLEIHRTYSHRHEKICNICGKRFKDFKTYQEHRKIHENYYKP